MVLDVTGELDGVGAPLLRRTWDAEVETLSDRIRVDLGRVTFCNAAGLHVLDEILTSCEERRLVLTLVVQPRLAWLIRVVMLSVDDRAHLVISPRLPSHVPGRLGGTAGGEVA